MRILVALGVFGLCVLAVWLAARWRAWRRSRRARRRAARAGMGEVRAAALLERAGYAIVARQVRAQWTPLVDGEPCAIELRADYVVARGGEQLVAEVKTGEAAPSLDTAATRRQLLEYAVAFAVDGVLLVVPERDAIHRVEFTRLSTTAARAADGTTT